MKYILVTQKSKLSTFLRYFSQFSNQTKISRLTGYSQIKTLKKSNRISGLLTELILRKNSFTIASLTPSLKKCKRL